MDSQRVRSDFAQREASDGDRWRDRGWWLIIPLAIAMASTFRKGWVVRTAVLLLAVNVFSAESARADSLIDMWLTRDQQGRIQFERGNSLAAAERFVDPVWKGVALYRSGKFQEAVDALATLDTPESWYDQGNALMHLSKYDEAVVAYGKALETRKDWPEATANLAIAQRFLKAQQEKQEDQPEQPSEAPDSVQFDEKGKQGKEGTVEVAEQASETWMKNIAVSPADLMARKFSIEAGRMSR